MTEPVRFSCHAAHLVLHSFPTRRSSDLPRPLAPASGARRGPDGASDVDLEPSTKAETGDQRDDEPVPDPPVGAADQRDRKSTRLNSSHPSISYAVFCLKKKRLKV